ncbi:uncharacterized protein LOC113235315 [Hyposmocoma kahamanoa]|uniref:uncharacterized protein LOC113235315 n=1 Tax=Hyposmocoma kahamanoa TaxID=1477025 RepID=UPI000E6D5BA4|nr:uncharacterized protein LOC113235315 [Hyposmocoma kahamanoa]
MANELDCSDSRLYVNSNNDLSSAVETMLEELDNLEDNTQIDIGDMDLQNTQVGKRRREHNEEEEWTTVTRNAKKKNRDTQNPSIILPIQVSVVTKDKLPKQFALAKLLKVNDITDIYKVKYANPYKLLITFETESSAEKFMICQTFTELGWRRQKTWEVALSYGVIRDIDPDLSEEDLLKDISCDVEVITAKRLNRRTEEGWISSETVRIGFSGPSVPPYVYLFDLRVRVETYRFPVTQCSRCWRFGHVIKMCPSNKIICPKCGQHHANCETTSFKCVNCSGKHMALSKQCPIFKKERHIRELMAVHNCSYLKAVSMYVPSGPLLQSNKRRIETQSPAKNSTQDEPESTLIATASYAEVVKTKFLNSEIPRNTSNLQNKRKKKNVPLYLTPNVIAQIDMTTSDGSSSAFEEEPVIRQEK